MNNKNKKNLFTIVIIVCSAVMFFGHTTKAQQGNTFCCVITWTDIRPGGANGGGAYDETEAACVSGGEVCQKRISGFNSTYFTCIAIPNKNAKASPDNKSCIPNATTNATTAVKQEVSSKCTLPVLSVSIPGFTNFSAIPTDPTAPCGSNWLAEYIKALYKYSIIVIGILAVIVMMIGGIMWLTAGGNKERISEAMKLIKGGIMGIIIALCSYALLFILNPNLTVLSPINVKYVANEMLPDLDLSKSAEELGISQTDLTELRGENPYQAGCGNIEKCKQFGSTQPPGLVKVDSEYGTGLVKPSSYEAFKKAVTCVDKDKKKFKINEGWRSAAGQIDVKKRKPTMAATPCCSNHGSGEAMDLGTRIGDGTMSWEYNTSSGFEKCANQNGLFAKMNPKLGSKKNEPWHFSPTGF